MDHVGGERVRQRIRVQGIVQGVGFRPFVYSLARQAGLAGFVGNDPHGVFIEVEGGSAAIERFRGALGCEAPPLAVIDSIEVSNMEPAGADGFVIAESGHGGQREALISPDTATCDDCLAELFDPSDRRHAYPFVNCTNCGPRFTIVRDIPYDRPYTTMAGFPLCAACDAEYHDPADRRFHAQPVCCPQCGPRLRLLGRTGEPVEGAPVAEDPGGGRPVGVRPVGDAPAAGGPLQGAAAALRAGRVVAIKGLGGYHLAADATSAAAVGALRSRKHREDKAFAVMVADVAAARTLCHVDAAEERALAGFRRPVVLLRRRDGSAVADEVAPGNRDLGLMLPYTPLHHLLAARLAAPFVLTSGNVSDEPIAYDDAEALERLAGIADVFLTHDRPIHIRTDDSVVRVFRERERPVRRSRGYVPEPLSLGLETARPVLACGAELKNTFCLASGNRAFVSHHVGDLENYETMRSFTEGVEHFRRLFRVTPEVVAHDLHPEYLSTKYAVDLEGVDLVGVQHHHAHIAACLADNRERGPVIGVAFDGLGFGADEAIWGGEFLVADLAGFDRAGHLDYVPMPGGAAAIREPWRIAAAYVDAAYGSSAPDDLAVAGRQGQRWQQVVKMARSRTNAPLTSSAGRLFDAVAALLGVRDAINYEGQAAVELEQRAVPGEAGSYPARSEGAEPFRVIGADLVRAVVADLRAGVDPAVVAGRFHNGVAALIVDGCALVRSATGLGAVALSGGVFQNQLLLSTTVDALERDGFRVLVHGRVPTNDGGISFGQAAVAAARIRATA